MSEISDLQDFRLDKVPMGKTHRFMKYGDHVYVLITHRLVNITWICKYQRDETGWNLTKPHNWNDDPPKHLDSLADLPEFAGSTLVVN